MGPVQNSRATAQIEMPSCGASTDEVTDAQRALNVLYGESELEVNGRMDPPTTRAVIAFQLHEGLTPTGCLDPGTQTALLRAAAHHDPEGPSMFGGVESPVASPTPVPTPARAESAELVALRRQVEARLRDVSETTASGVRTVAASGRGNVSSHAQTSRTLPTDADATRAFDAQVDRLFDVHNWTELSGVENASFALFNPQGDRTDREARVGDFVRVDLPGPVPMAWVRIESASRDGSRAEIVVRPSHDPTLATPDPSITAHFFTNDATNTFSVSRSGRTVTADVTGRNENANSAQTTGLVDRVVNRVTSEVAWGAFDVGLQGHQWERFTANLSRVSR